MVSRQQHATIRHSLVLSVIGLAIVLAAIGFVLLRFDSAIVGQVSPFLFPIQSTGPLAGAAAQSKPDARLTDRPAPTAVASDRQATILSASQAKERVRQFVGNPNLPLVGLLESGTFGGRRFSTYHFETLTDADEEVDEFKIDARTGEVLEAWLRSDGPTGAPVDRAAAERVARDFGARRFDGFLDLALVEESAAPSARDGTLYRFKWAQLATPSGAELPVSATIAVSARLGRVVWFLGQRDPVEVETTPAIPRERAVAVAAEQAAAEARWEATPRAVRLQVIYDDENRQRLVWSAAFGALGNGRASLRLFVDAQTGALLSLGGPRG